MSKPLNVAVTGAGYFSQYHISAWCRHPLCNLIAITDSDQAKAQAFDLCPTYVDIESMLHSHRPDILDIITPPSTHLDFIQQACLQGVKTIICQKPFCSNTKQAEEAIRYAEHSESTLVVHDNFRFQPWYRYMKDAIDKQLIGEPLQMTFRLRTGDGQGKDAYLDRQPYFRNMRQFLVRETAVHFMDVFCFLFGPVMNVNADLRQINPVIAGEDSAYIISEHANGVRSVFDGNRLLDHPAADQRLTLGEALLEGTGGAISLDGNGQLTMRPFSSDKYTVLLPARQWLGFGGDSVYALQNQVVTSILSGTTPENVAKHYLPVLQLVDTIYESAKLGKKIKVA